MSHRQFATAWITAFVITLLFGTTGCDSDIHLVMTPGTDYSTAVGTYSAIMVSTDGDVNDPDDLPSVKIESVQVENSAVLTATADNSLQRVLVYAQTVGQSEITIETDQGTESIVVTVLESDGISYVEDLGIDANLPAPTLWLENGISELEFIWNSQGKPLLGANVAQLESADAQMMMVVPYSSFEDVNLATVHFYQTGTALLKTPGVIPDLEFEIVDASRISRIQPVFLVDTASGLSANTSEDTLHTDVKMADWWRVAAYDDNNQRIGGLDGNVDVRLVDSAGCGFYVIGYEFSLYRQTPGTCTVEITIGSFQETVSYTYR